MRVTPLAKLSGGGASARTAVARTQPSMLACKVSAYDLRYGIQSPMNTTPVVKPLVRSTVRMMSCLHN